MEALINLEAVLCGPDGKCCISGSDADRQIVDESLAALRAALASQQDVAAPVGDAELERAINDYFDGNQPSCKEAMRTALTNFAATRSPVAAAQGLEGVGAVPDFRGKIASIERSFSHVDGTTFQTPWVKVEFLPNDWDSRNFFADWLATPAQSVPAGVGESNSLESGGIKTPALEPMAKLRVYMDRHDMGQSLAPNPPYKVAIATALKAADFLPLGVYELYLSAPLQPQDGKDARTDSVHLGSGASGNVPAPGPTDAQRLDFLETTCTAYGFEDVHEGNAWYIDGPFSNVRKAIDAAILSTASPAGEGEVKP